MHSKENPPGRAERLVRAVLLLCASLVFSVIAWAAGAYQLEVPWIYGVIGGVVIAALLVSRFGAKLVIRRLAK